MFGDILTPPLNTVQISIPTTTGDTKAPLHSTSSRKASMILSSKPAIQPKPSDLLHLGPVPSLIKVEPTSPVTGATGPSTTPFNSVAGKPVTSKPIVPAPCHTGTSSFDIDVKVLRRQQRMIKNRESACQSRKKKKEYLQGLETKLQEALCENERLRRENTALRKRLDSFITEHPIHIQNVTAAFSDVKDLVLRDIDRLFTSTDCRQFNRTESLRNVTAAFSDVKDLVLRDIDRLFTSTDCRQFNRTESLRLADELRGWVHRHQINRKKGVKSPRAKKAKIAQKAQQRKINLARYLPVHPQRTLDRVSSSQLQLYPGLQPRHQDFMEAIDRREDTFYVVSFRRVREGGGGVGAEERGRRRGREGEGWRRGQDRTGQDTYVVSFMRDHLLLPAISHNKTSRPKMSLVMPAMAHNGT
ncbi:UNVERIFIED_CONTAM: hypothetical protein FKN15_056467 [Acipenser sinensis]